MYKLIGDGGEEPGGSNFRSRTRLLDIDNKPGKLKYLLLPFWHF